MDLLSLLSETKGSQLNMNKMHAIRLTQEYLHFASNLSYINRDV